MNSTSEVIDEFDDIFAGIASIVAEELRESEARSEDLTFHYLEELNRLWVAHGGAEGERRA